MTSDYASQQISYSMTSITIVATKLYRKILRVCNVAMLRVHSTSIDVNEAWYYGDIHFIILPFDFIASSDAVHFTCSTRYRSLMICSTDTDSRATHCVFMNCMQLQGFLIDSHRFDV